MFTGIVEETGCVERIERHGDYVRLGISARNIICDLAVGASIALNGTCQTVEKFSDSGFTVAAFAETLRKTNLGHLEIGDGVHLERALRATDRLGGHIVQGHVDGLGYLGSVSKIKDNYYLRVELGEELLNLCVLHGSICIDGVSLTIARLHEDGIAVNIIEHTWVHTLFSSYAVRRALNIECDVLGKYILHFARKGLLAAGTASAADTASAAGQALAAGRASRLKDLLIDW